METKKVILITGASSGMGKITAEELIKVGHIVYCAARSVEKMKDLGATVLLNDHRVIRRGEGCFYWQG